MSGPVVLVGPTEAAANDMSHISSNMKTEVGSETENHG